MYCIGDDKVFVQLQITADRTTQVYRTQIEDRRINTTRMRTARPTGKHDDPKTHPMLDDGQPSTAYRVAKAGHHGVRLGDGLTPDVEDTR